MDGIGSSIERKAKVVNNTLAAPNDKLAIGTENKIAASLNLKKMFEIINWLLWIID